MHVNTCYNLLYLNVRYIDTLACMCIQGVPMQEGLQDVDTQVEVLDLGSFQSIIAFVARLKSSGSKVDVLINNAGVCGIPKRCETTDGLEMQIGVNHFGGHLLARLMEPIISDGGRVVFLSSTGHNSLPGMSKTTWDWDNINYDKPNSYKPWMAYGRSKLANILDAKEFGKRLASRGINMYAVHPGLVQTEISRNVADGRVMSPINRAGVSVLGSMRVLATPLAGSLTTLRCAVDPKLSSAEYSGKY